MSVVSSSVERSYFPPWLWVEVEIKGYSVSGDSKG